jgi:hypothetical protein
MWTRSHHPRTGECSCDDDGDTHCQDAAAARIDPDPSWCLVVGPVVTVLAEQPTNPRRYLPPAET